jgi:hypothetical protein
MTRVTVEREFEVVSDELRKAHRGLPTPAWLAAVREGKTIRLAEPLPNGMIGSYSNLLARDSLRLRRKTIDGSQVLWAERREPADAD